VTVALALLAIGAGILVARRRWLVVIVRGNSMAPTLHDGQRLIVRRGRDYATGDIIVFRVDAPGTPALRVKRVAALAGQPIPFQLRAGVLAAVPAAVPAHHVVVAGDNAHSEDSRHLGFVTDAAIQGVVRRFPEARHRR